MVCVCIYTQIHGFVLSHKNNEILSFVTTQMDLEGIMSKWNKSDREERQILHDFIYMWNLKKQTNKWTNMTKQKHTYKYREQTGDCQMGGAGGEIGDDS